MRLLVLGGSWFVGREVTEQAIARGWDVTVFNRGRSGTVPNGAARIKGDRENPNDLAALADRGRWDAVIDVPGSIPTVVRDSARALRNAVDRYVFVSTVSAYKRWPSEPVTEESVLHEGRPDWDPGFRHWDAAAYGPLKAGCEAALHREFDPEQLLFVRPGVVLGPHEYVGRMRWWLTRAQQGGNILAPGRPDRGIQPVDVRDVATFLLDLTASGRHGAFNIAAPTGRDTYADLVNSCLEATGTSADVTWVDADWLVNQQVRQWTEIPLWRTAPGTWQMDTQKAGGVGLLCRPLAETVADTWAWLNGGGSAVSHERDAEHGIDPGKEQRILEAADREGRIVARTRRGLPVLD
jgi:2'-hydroxyisoflavone reductase